MIEHWCPSTKPRPQEHECHHWRKSPKKVQPVEVPRSSPMSGYRSVNHWSLNWSMNPQWVNLDLLMRTHAIVTSPNLEKKSYHRTWSYHINRTRDSDEPQRSSSRGKGSLSLERVTVGTCRVHLELEKFFMHMIIPSLERVIVFTYRVHLGTEEEFTQRRCNGQLNVNNTCELFIFTVQRSCKCTQSII